MNLFLYLWCVVVASVAWVASGQSFAAEIHVSPKGLNTNPGDVRRPLATIAAALKKTRESEEENDVILVEGGRYFHKGPIQLDERDNGLTIKGTKPGAQAELYGGVPVTGWERWKGGIWRASVPKGQRFYNLIVDGNAAIMARTPNAGSGYGGGAASVGDQDTWKDRDKVSIPAEWRSYDFSDAQVFAFHDSNWFSGMHAVLSGPDEEGLLTVNKGNLGKRIYMRGVLEFLDEPGEWCLKHQEGYLYYWPVKESPEDHLIVRPTSENFIEISGSSPGKSANNISIENISIIGSDFCQRWFAGPHNTAPEKQQRAMVFGQNVKAVTVKNCRLQAAGHSAVMFNRHAQDCVVESNFITQAGYSGVYLNGWEIGEGPFAKAQDSYVNKNHRIENNFIHDCGKLVGSGAGIQFYQSGGNLIARNEISRMPRYGISYKGMRMGVLPRLQYRSRVEWDNHWDFLHSRDNKIVGNDIHHVCRESHDFGAIECWGVGRDNLWENNAVHDIDSAVEWDGYSSIMYADDHSHYLTMRNNILYQCHGGNMNAFALRNIAQTAENNLLVDSSVGRIATLTAFNEPAWGFTIRNNVFAIQPRHERYKVDAGTFKGSGGGILPRVPPDVAKGIAEINHNVVIPTDPAVPNPAPYPEYAIDLDSRFDDPKIIRSKPIWDLEYADYSVAPDSPAHKAGYKPIPTDKIGLRKDFPFDRQTLTRHAAKGKIQAENFDRMSNLRSEASTGIRQISPGAWAKYSNIDFGNGEASAVRIAMDAVPTNGTVLELRLGSPEGKVIGTIKGELREGSITKVTGIHNVFLVFPGPDVRTVDHFEFITK